MSRKNNLHRHKAYEKLHDKTLHGNLEFSSDLFQKNNNAENGYMNILDPPL